MPKRKKKRRSTEPVEMTQMPFDDAIRKILGAPQKKKKKKK